MLTCVIRFFITSFGNWPGRREGYVSSPKIVYCVMLDQFLRFYVTCLCLTTSHILYPSGMIAMVFVHRLYVCVYVNCKKERLSSMKACLCFGMQGECGVDLKSTALAPQVDGMMHWSAIIGECFPSRFSKSQFP